MAIALAPEARLLSHHLGEAMILSPLSEYLFERKPFTFDVGFRNRRVLAG
jgi:hypothetical protein